jgi:hypothetical protein
MSRGRLKIFLFASLLLFGCNADKRMMRKQVKEQIKAQKEFKKLLIKYPNLINLDSLTHNLEVITPEKAVQLVSELKDTVIVDEKTKISVQLKNIGVKKDSIEIKIQVPKDTLTKNVKLPKFQIDNK